MDIVLKDKYQFEVEGLNNPAYLKMVKSDKKAEELFKALKEKSHDIEWLGKEPHTFNVYKDSEVGFYISGYYVTFLMVQSDFYLIRVFGTCLKTNVYTCNEEIYMKVLNGSVIDFESTFGFILNVKDDTCDGKSNKQTFKENYYLDIDDLYNPAYSRVIEDDDKKAEKLFETLKEKAYKTEWFDKKPHTFNGDDNCEVGFFISGYYVSFMMVDDHMFQIRVHVGCIDIDIYTGREDLYMLDLDSSLIDFESKFHSYF
jgi:hypothetical protein